MIVDLKHPGINAALLRETEGKQRYSVPFVATAYSQRDSSAFIMSTVIEASPGLRFISQGYNDPTIKRSENSGQLVVFPLSEPLQFDMTTLDILFDLLTHRDPVSLLFVTDKLEDTTTPLSRRLSLHKPGVQGRRLIDSELFNACRWNAKLFLGGGVST